MGGEKVTIMVLNVDLQCCKCYKKVKKILCKIPYIQDQEYDEKNGTVTIRVVCCSPEKIKEKIICKGGDFIKSIEIKVPEKPVPEPHPPPAHGKPKPTCEKPPPPPPPVLVQIGVCCQQCYHGHPGGPCFHGHGWPPACYPCPGYCGRIVFDSCGCGRNCYTSDCDTQGCTIL